MAVSKQVVMEEAYAVARRLYPTWSTEDREDLVQEVLIRYFRQFGTGAAPDNMGAWLTTATRHTARDLHAAQQVRPHGHLAGGDPLELLASFASLQLASLGPIQDKLIGQILGLLDDERTRAVLRYKFLDNLSSREIGGELGLAPNTVDQIASRGKRQLAAALETRPDLVEELHRAHPRNY